MPTDPALADATVGLRRYLELRRRSTGSGLDAARMMREWLASSAAWLEESDERGELVEAIVELDRAACEARAELAVDRFQSVSTFFGVVTRMDAVSAEVEGRGEALLVPRDDLERHGLAILDQPVSARAASPWSTTPFEDGSVPGTVLPDADRAWLDRELAREPTAAPVAPLRLA